MLIQNDKCQYLLIHHCWFDIFGYCFFFAKYDTYQLVSCGGKGFAVVLSAGGFNLGSTGSGLGYQNLNNVFAIEFDTSTDSSLNDPNNGNQERHVSVIVNQGAA